MKKRGRKKHTGVYWKISSELFGFFYILPFTVTEISARSSKNFTYLSWGKQCIGLQIAYFYPITSFPFIVLREKWKIMVNRLLFTVFHQKLDSKIQKINLQESLFQNSKIAPIIFRFILFRFRNSNRTPIQKKTNLFFFFKNTLAKTSEGVKRSLFKKTYSRQSSIQLSEEKLFYPDSNGKNRALQLL